MTRIFAAVLVGLLGGLLVAACTGRVPSPCTACDGVCVDLNVDSRNCGACGTRCPGGAVCAGGACVASCPVGQAQCDGGCFDTQVDPRHCGLCGRACTGSCRDGTCQTAQPCLAPLADCSGQCVDVSSNVAHCGGCGRSCDAGYCVRGACAPSCPLPLATCSGACVDTRSDPANCGTCGTGCGLGFCRDAGCEPACQAPLLECAGGCADPRNDPANCGACGAPCDGGYCLNRACVSTCPLTTCGNACVDVGTDERHCGACGRTCALPNAAQAACAGGECTVAGCQPGYLDCDGVAANGCESAEGCVVPVTVTTTGALANDPRVVEYNTATNAAATPLRTADLSDDGRIVAFVSASSQLAAGDTNGVADVFVRDMAAGVTRNVTQASTADSTLVAVSGDGRVVVFVTAGGLVGADTNGAPDVYAWDVAQQTLTLVTTSADGGPSNGTFIEGLDITWDAGAVVYASTATNLVEPPTPIATQGLRKLYRTELSTRRHTLLYGPPAYDGGACGFFSSAPTPPRISEDGRWVTFATPVRVLPTDSNQVFDQYVIDPDGGLGGASVTTPGSNFVTTGVCGQAGIWGDIDAEGRVVTFHGNENLIAVPNDSVNDVFTRDLAGASTRRVTLAPDGGSANGESGFPFIDRSGTRVAYLSTATNLVGTPLSSVGQRCFVSDVGPAGVVRTFPVAVGARGEYPRCNGLRVSGNGRALLFATPAPLSLADAPSPPDGGGMDLYLRIAP